MDDSTNLDRLNDIVLPPEVAAWPLAPGWWVLIVMLIAGVSYFSYVKWKKWRANAYRREALRELESAEDAAAIGEILRRAALAFTPRKTVAAKTGKDWVDWLDARCPEKISSDLRGLLISGPYTAQPPSQSVEKLREYAAHWIHDHRFPESGTA